MSGPASASLPDFAAIEQALARPRNRQVSTRMLTRLGFDKDRLTDAAVLCALCDGPNGLEMILTERVAHLTHHAGQVSFPGGRIDARDVTVEAAALREAHEEIALHPQDVTVLGRLRDYPTITGFRITPIVAKVSADITLVPNPQEVAAVFKVPLAFLLDPRNAQESVREINGAPLTLHSFQYGEFHIWGATATMIMDFVRLFDTP